MNDNSNCIRRRIGCTAAVLMLSWAAACKPSPVDTSPSGWARVEIEKTYSIAHPPSIERRPYGHPEGSVALFKSEDMELHIALLHTAVGVAPRPVSEPNAKIDGRAVRIERLPSNGLSERPGLKATFGDIGDENTFLMISADCRDAAAQETAEKMVRSIQFLPLRPKRSLPPIPDPPAR